MTRRVVPDGEGNFLVLLSLSNISFLLDICNLYFHMVAGVQLACPEQGTAVQAIL